MNDFPSLLEQNPSTPDTHPIKSLPPSLHRLLSIGAIALIASLPSCDVADPIVQGAQGLDEAAEAAASSEELLQELEESGISIETNTEKTAELEADFEDQTGLYPGGALIVKFGQYEESPVLNLGADEVFIFTKPIIVDPAVTPPQASFEIYQQVGEEWVRLERRGERLTREGRIGEQAADLILETLETDYDLKRTDLAQQLAYWGFTPEQIIAADVDPFFNQAGEEVLRRFLLRLGANGQTETVLELMLARGDDGVLRYLDLSGAGDNLPQVQTAATGLDWLVTGAAQSESEFTPEQIAALQGHNPVFSLDQMQILDAATGEILLERDEAEEWQLSTGLPMATEEVAATEEAAEEPTATATEEPTPEPTPTPEAQLLPTPEVSLPERIASLDNLSQSTKDVLLPNMENQFPIVEEYDAWRLTCIGSDFVTHEPTIKLPTGKEISHTFACQYRDVEGQDQEVHFPVYTYDLAEDTDMKLGYKARDLSILNEPSERIDNEIEGYTERWLGPIKSLDDVGWSGSEPGHVFIVRFAYPEADSENYLAPDIQGLLTPEKMAEFAQTGDPSLLTIEVNGQQIALLLPDGDTGASFDNTWGAEQKANTGSLTD